ncbi:Orn/DAP/Arg decarboxylase 2 [Burkholderia lata]|uniref:Orn/DAP/Arg decarboxylase 2 n=1 Tax=Burkholderia lata (strain ATCC 17760 / DSM 23089 / LMG 22485 / NCIMB 9086 / R18194 / 383) TaxID=482957 RepID=A0A6P2NUZ4_BURL3|nr:alanine racemase [Burkholderia lata]VWB99011.1 Orn/DAP/Arg decarboxylase 2 [Burkholderia lata]
MNNLIRQHLAAFGGDRRSVPPAYFFDVDEIVRRFAELHRSLPDNFELAYSLKANSEKPIVDSVAHAGSSALFDVSSLHELNVTCEAGVAPSRIVFTGPGKTRDELHAAVERDIGFIVCESIQEIEAVNGISRSMGKRSSVLIRINPDDVDVKVERQFSGDRSHFGISQQDAEHIASRLDAWPWVDIQGLHFYVGSRNLDAANIAENFFTFARIFNAINEAFGRRLTTLDLGGGFGVPYFPGESPLDLGQLARSLASFDGIWPTRVLVESGRFISASAGTYLCQVLYTKRVKDRHVAIVNGGLTSFYLPSDNIPAAHGSSLRNFGITAVGDDQTPIQGTLREYDIYGNAPTSSDVLALAAPLPELKPGSLLKIANAGAYGITASLNNFLGRGKPHAYYFGMQNFKKGT